MNYLFSWMSVSWMQIQLLLSPDSSWLAVFLEPHLPKRFAFVCRHSLPNNSTLLHSLCAKSWTRIERQVKAKPEQTHWLRQFTALAVTTNCLGVDHNLCSEFHVRCSYVSGPQWSQTEQVVRPAQMQSHWKHINGESGFLLVALPVPVYAPACPSVCLFVLSRPASFSLLFVFSLDQQYLDRF